MPPKLVHPCPCPHERKWPELEFILPWVVMYHKFRLNIPGPDSTEAKSLTTEQSGEYERAKTMARNVVLLIRRIARRLVVKEASTVADSDEAESRRLIVESDYVMGCVIRYCQLARESLAVTTYGTFDEECERWWKGMLNDIRDHNLTCCTKAVSSVDGKNRARNTPEGRLRRALDNAWSDNADTSSKACSQTMVQLLVVGRNRGESGRDTVKAVASVKEKFKRLAPPPPKSKPASGGSRRRPRDAGGFAQGVPDNPGRTPRWKKPRGGQQDPAQYRDTLDRAMDDDDLELARQALSEMTPDTMKNIIANEGHDLEWLERLRSSIQGWENRFNYGLYGRLKVLTEGVILWHDAPSSSAPRDQARRGPVQEDGVEWMAVDPPAGGAEDGGTQFVEQVNAQRVREACNEVKRHSNAGPSIDPEYAFRVLDDARWSESSQTDVDLDEVRRVVLQMTPFILEHIVTQILPREYKETDSRETWFEDVLNYCGSIDSGLTRHLNNSMSQFGNGVQQAYVPEGSSRHNIDQSSFQSPSDRNAGQDQAVGALAYYEHRRGDGPFIT